MHDDSTDSSCSTVYFLQGRQTRLIKIGVTRDLAKRLEGFGTHSAEELDLLASITADPALEKALHVLFAPDRVHGEWFRPSRDLMAFIEALPIVRTGSRQPTRTKDDRHTLAFQIYAVLTSPMSLVELSNLTNASPNVLRMTMRRKPDMFYISSTRPNGHGGHDTAMWSRTKNGADQPSE